MLLNDSVSVKAGATNATAATSYDLGGRRAVVQIEGNGTAAGTVKVNATARAGSGKWTLLNNGTITTGANDVDILYVDYPYHSIQFDFSGLTAGAVDVYVSKVE